jgi:hypothetical protein
MTSETIAKAEWDSADAETKASLFRKNTAYRRLYIAITVARQLYALYCLLEEHRSTILELIDAKQASVMLQDAPSHNERINILEIMKNEIAIDAIIFAEENVRNHLLRI